MKQHPKILISGGGTGGHVFPAISIANALKRKVPEADVLFVGANGRIEMDAVPDAGYRIIGLPVTGFPRKFHIKTVLFFYNLVRSLWKSRRIINRFKPDAVVGVGGFASGPVGRIAAKKGIPLLLQEQNSYAGITNKLLARKAQAICVAYDGMQKYFPAEKIIKTGNPVRSDLIDLHIDTSEALRHFGLNIKYSKIVLVLGGSGGARQINQSMIANKELIKSNPDVAFIWQTGKNYYQAAINAVGENEAENLVIRAFIRRMDYAYGLADLVISRSGAGTISELGILGKPALFVPSPNVAEDHQTRNAKTLADAGAAEIVEDSRAVDELVDTALHIVTDDAKLDAMSRDMKSFGMPDAAGTIADQVLKIRNNRS